MRFVAPLLSLAASALFVAGAHAAPGSEDLDRLLADKGLLTQIDQQIGRIGQVTQNVSSKASELVFNAMGFMGVPYRRGGNSTEADGGFDCSGFVRAMYEQTVGLLLPRKAEQQAAVTQNIGKNDLQPGDLVFFNTMRRAFSHVGIYVGNDKFIHSPRPGAQVRVESMSTSYWDRRFDGARRVATRYDEGPVSTASAASLLPAAVPIQALQQAQVQIPSTARQQYLLGQ